MIFELERWKRCYFEKGTRYYLATLQQDLFGERVLKREWGNIERRSVQSLVMTAMDYEKALEHLAATIKRRQQRRYTEIAVAVAVPDNAETGA